MRSLVLVVLVACVEPPAPQMPVAPPANPQVELAARANREGEQLLAAHRFEEAGRRFLEAIARSAEPLYYLNLCAAYRGDNRLDDAERSCEAAVTNAPNDVFADEARHRLGEIRALREPPQAPHTAEITTVAGPTPGRGSQAEIAFRVNEEGKQLSARMQWGAASSKFREAVARVPEPAYFYNLCTSLYQEGKFGEALTACNAVLVNTEGPIAEQARRLMARVKAEARRQGIQVAP